MILQNNFSSLFNKTPEKDKQISLLIFKGLANRKAF
jgi:hypothetical protein